MSTLIQSFDNLHDNRVLRCCADFEAHTLPGDTLQKGALIEKFDELHDF